MKFYIGLFPALLVGLSFSSQAVAETPEGETILAHCGACGGGDKNHKHSTAKKKAKAKAKSIAKKIADQKELGTLHKALKASGFIGVLDKTEKFTIFAPSDAAFNRMNQTTLKAALNDPNGKLKTLLKHHIIKGKLLPSDVKGQLRKKTLLGQDILIQKDQKTISINGKSKVIKASIECENGLIHIVDRVVLAPK